MFSRAFHDHIGILPAALQVAFLDCALAKGEAITGLTDSENETLRTAMGAYHEQLRADVTAYKRTL